MKTLGCLGILSVILFATLFVPLLHILTIVPFLVCIFAFALVGVIQLVKGATTR